MPEKTDSAPRTVALDDPKSPSATVVPEVAVRPRARPSTSRVLKQMGREWRMYVLILPGLLFLVIFRYLPLAGNVIAFQDFSPFLGPAGSPFVGFENFAKLLSDPELLNAIKNTLIISSLQIVFAFPAPIALALLLNSIMGQRVKSFIQSVVYLPHFLSWVVVVALWQAVLGGDGMLNGFLSSMGMDTVNIMSNPAAFYGVVTLQVMWKEVGWGTIIFLAAITKIDPELYEAAAVDGAGPKRRLWSITLPGILPVFVLLLILRLGSVLTVGFEQILIQQPAVGRDVAQVLDTFVYFNGIVGGNWGVASAAGLLQGLIGTVLVIGANRLSKRLGTEGAF